MRPGSPVPSAGRRRRSSGALSRSRRSRRSLRCSLRGSYRNKSPAAAEEDEPRVPELLLQDMNLCYRLLPPGRATSRVEILQHVIDYILDLQTELDAFCPAGDRGEPLHRDRIQQRPQSGESSGTSSHTCQVGNKQVIDQVLMISSESPAPVGLKTNILMMYRLENWSLNSF